MIIAQTISTNAFPNELWTASKWTVMPLADEKCKCSTAASGFNRKALRGNRQKAPTGVGPEKSCLLPQIPLIRKIISKNYFVLLRSALLGMSWFWATACYWKAFSVTEVFFCMCSPSVLVVVVLAYVFRKFYVPVNWVKSILFGHN